MRSYARLGKADRAKIAANLAAPLAARSMPGAIRGAEGKFPQRTGALKISPKY